MSTITQFPPRLRAVRDDEPDREPALVLAMPVRMVPVLWCRICQLSLPEDHLNGDHTPTAC